MNAQDFINSVATGNAAEAKDTLNNLLSARAFEALETKKIEIAQTLFGGYQVEEEVELDEATMTGITLGQKVKNKQGGYNQDVHHKGEKIGHIEAYKHRTGMRYGGNHDATGEMTAGNRDAEDAIADIRFSHAQHLKDTKVKKEQVEQIDELSKQKYQQYLDVSKKEVKKHNSGSQLSRYGDTAGDRGSKQAGKNYQDRELNTQNAQDYAKKKLGISTVKKHTPV